MTVASIKQSSILQGVAQKGSVLQVVSTTKTNTFTTSSRTYTDVTGLAATITPSATSSKILIVVAVTGVTDTDGAGNARPAGLRVTGGSAASFVGSSPGDRIAAFASLEQVTGSSQRQVGFTGGNYLDSPSTTSAVTYQVQAVQPVSGTIYINRALDDVDDQTRVRTVSTITVMEVAG